MMDNTKEYILCAAVKRKTPRDAHRCYHEKYCDIYNIETGWRHADIIYRFMGELDEDQQGFLTSTGRYVDRKEAAKIAFECGQIKKEIKVLYSEDIY